MTPIDKIKRRLKDFAAVASDAPDLGWYKNRKCFTIERWQFPIPNLLLFLLNGICGFPFWGRGEKTHWIVPFIYRGHNYEISHEKFGLRLYAEKGTDDKLKEVLGKLQKALEFAEKYLLSGFASEQIANGNITISNQFSSLDRQYRYFRNNAASEYSSKEELASVDSNKRSLTEILNRSSKASRYGGYNALAMIDAYFSRLEHLLVLALPFVGYDREHDNLAEFVGSKWSDKFRRVLNQSDKHIKQHYDALVEIKEKFRNTFSHGGFEKKGQSFSFHLGNYAIPASMSGIRDSVHFNYYPIEKDGFEMVCSVFDEFDAHLSIIALPKAWKYCKSNLNLAFDEKNLTELLTAAEDPETYNAWIEKIWYLSDIYDNADY